MRRTWIWTVLFLAFLNSSCASFPPRNPDGSINVAILVQYAEQGIQADCQLMPGSSVCTVGTNVIAILKSKGQDPVAVLAALVDVEQRFPVIKPYVHWIVPLLGGVA